MSESARNEGYTCGICGQHHEGLSFDIAFNAPFPWIQIPKPERNERGELTVDFCRIDGREFFVRGLIEIPVLDSNHTFTWGVWALLRREDIFRLIQLWHDPKIIDEPSYFGRLANRLPAYPDTLGLEVSVQSRNVKERPFFTIKQTDHPLAVDQQNGIDYARVQEFSARITEGDSPTPGNQ